MRIQNCRRGIHTFYLHALLEGLWPPTLPLMLLLREVAPDTPPVAGCAALVAPAVGTAFTKRQAYWYNISNKSPTIKKRRSCSCKSCLPARPPVLLVLTRFCLIKKKIIINEKNGKVIHLLLLLPLPRTSRRPPIPGVASGSSAPRPHSCGCAQGRPS